MGIDPAFNFVYDPKLVCYFKKQRRGASPTPDQKGINSNTLLEHPAAPTKNAEKRMFSTGIDPAFNFVC
ncbi:MULTISPECIES: hypothetical protein [unclassified Shewanella]|uniref:hypothetical protein n=1 Tax=unclassified Shewanella TaxID=196818 RepID=UPI000C81F502|nr:MULTISPECIES: hypothetical protein [unclassified Shewanella]PMG50821.1 hypothetical protein BCU91_01745 [Shewanella sp. 10N.286.52.B9]